MACGCGQSAKCTKCGNNFPLAQIKEGKCLGCRNKEEAEKKAKGK